MFDRVVERYVEKVVLFHRFYGVQGSYELDLGRQFGGSVEVRMFLNRQLKHVLTKEIMHNTYPALAKVSVPLHALIYVQRPLVVFIEL